MTTRKRLPKRPKKYEDFTEEELLVAPIKLLTPHQRRRRRAIRNKRGQVRRKAVRQARLSDGRGKVIYCQGNNKNGDPCGSYAVTGAKHCITHLNDAEKARLGKETLGEANARARKERLEQPVVAGRTLSGPQAMKQVLESAIEKCVSRYFQAVGFKFEGWDEEGVPIVMDMGAEKGICLHGESKDGYIQMTEYPDLATQIQVLEKLHDRVYGKPKQTQVLEGGVTPIRVQPVRSVERSKKVASLLHQVGAIPHEGRRRVGPSEELDESDHPGVESSEVESSNVVSLHDEELT